MTRVGRSLIGLLGAVVISVIVWDQIETRALEREIAEIAARGEPTGTPDPESVELTNEQREAARWYAGAAERAKQAVSGDGPAFGVSRVDIDNPAVQADLSQLEGKFRPDAPALQLLDRATPLDFKEFGAEAPELYTNQSPLQQLAQLNDVRADLLAARGQTDAAAQTLVASVRLLRTMPTGFYRFQATTHVLGSLRILFRRAPAGESALAPLQRELMALPGDDTLAREVLRMRATFLDRIAEPATSPFDAVAKRITRPIRVRAARRHLAAYDESLALAATPWPARMAAGRMFEAKYEPVVRGARSLSWWHWIAKPYGPAVVPIAVNTAGLELAARRVAIAAIAVERFRRAHNEAPPASLEALVPGYLPSIPVDPFTGVALVYRLTPTSYAVYSVDLDEKDDGGVFYGRGSRGQMLVRTSEPRDLGIRVDLKH